MSLNAIDDTRYGPVTRGEYAAMLERIAKLERRIAELEIKIVELERKIIERK